MKNKLIFIVLLLLATFTVNAAETNVESLDNFTFEFTGYGSVAKITDYNGLNTNIWIPSQVRNMPIAGIGEKAFYGKGLTSVKLPNSIILIGKQAFAGNEITQIIISSNVMLFDDSFDLGFPAFYMANERSAGTYVYDNGRWSRQAEIVPTTPAPVPAREKKEEHLLSLDPYFRFSAGLGLWDYGYSIISPRIDLNIGLMVIDYKKFKFGFTGEFGGYLGAAFPNFKDGGISYGFYFGSFLEMYFNYFCIALGGGMNRVNFYTKNDLFPKDFFPFAEIRLSMGYEEDLMGIYFRYYFNNTDGFANKFAVGIKSSLN